MRRKDHWVLNEVIAKCTYNLKIQQFRKSFAELESHWALTLNLKWKQLEEHLTEMVLCISNDQKRLVLINQ